MSLTPKALEKLVSLPNSSGSTRRIEPDNSSSNLVAPTPVIFRSTTPPHPGRIHDAVAEVTRRILPSNPFHLVTSATALATLPGSTLHGGVPTPKRRASACPPHSTAGSKSLFFL